MAQIFEDVSRTFNEFLLIPNLTDERCIPSNVSLKTPIVKYKKGEEAKICGGIGMQSHITVNYPSLEKYGTAVDKFLATGLQVQVTELDIGIEDGQTEEDLANHYSDIMKLLISKQENRDKSVNARGITGVTVWGLYDAISWRKPTSCLLFGESLEDPKPAFYSFLEAATK